MTDFETTTIGARDLIVQQAAEIERLTAENNELKRHIRNLQENTHYEECEKSCPGFAWCIDVDSPARRKSLQSPLGKMCEQWHD